MSENDKEVVIVNNYKKIACAIVCVGLACVATYLETHDNSGGFVWLGCFFAFMGATD